jgi:hypothetical protein
LGPRSATEIARRIGTLSKPLPVQEIFTLSQPTSLFGIIAHYGESLVYLINVGDYAQPEAIERTIHVFHGPTGTGKSRRAWEEAQLGGLPVYAKDPRSKFWYGYRSEDRVIVDEFRGGIDIAHLLRWLDRYPVCVETKGGSLPLVGSKMWITSNLHPRDWYPELDAASFAALERRLIIINIL